MTQDEVEAVARAFYEVQEPARGWEREHEILKERWRTYARIAIAAIDDCPADPSLSIAPLVVKFPLLAARAFLMEAEHISVLSGSTFRAVLRGPTHVFDVTNHAHASIVGLRDLINRPAREALPELETQGYFAVLDLVYSTRQTYIGRMTPIAFQKRLGGPIEEHIIDLVYRPIENATGDVIGVFVEGCDRTEQAGAWLTPGALT